MLVAGHGSGEHPAAEVESKDVRDERQPGLRQIAQVFAAERIEVLLTLMGDANTYRVGGSRRLSGRNANGTLQSGMDLQPALHSVVSSGG